MVSLEGCSSEILGRQIDPGKQLPGQINDSNFTLFVIASEAKQQDPAYRFAAFFLLTI